MTVVLFISPLGSELVSDSLCTRSVLFISMKTSLITSTDCWPHLSTIRSTTFVLSAGSSWINGMHGRPFLKWVNCRNHLNVFSSQSLKSFSVSKSSSLTAVFVATWKIQRVCSKRKYVISPLGILKIYLFASTVSMSLF